MDSEVERLLEEARTEYRQALDWLAEHDMDDGSFGLARSETGETNVPQHADLEPRMVLISSADGLDAFSLEEENAGLARRPGSDGDTPEAAHSTPRRRVYALWPESTDPEMDLTLRDFFEPYVAMLPAKYIDIINLVSSRRVSYSEVAAELGLKQRAAARSRVLTAVRALVRQVALDDPEFKDTPRKGRGRPRRDYAAEARAAWRVFDHYWTRRYGGSFGKGGGEDVLQ